MNPAPNFAPILDRSPTEVEKPKPLPQGSYVTILKGMPKYDKSTKKQTEYVEFTHQIVSAGGDVDEDALTEAQTAPDGSVRALQDVTIRNTYYLTENSLWRLKQFLADCGFDVEEEGGSFRQMIEETPGVSVGIYVKHEPSSDGQSVFATVSGTFQAA